MKSIGREIGGDRNNSRSAALALGLDCMYTSASIQRSMHGRNSVQPDRAFFFLLEAQRRMSHTRGECGKKLHQLEC